MPISTADFSFCPVLEEMLTNKSAVDAQGKVHNAFGLSTANNLVVLRNLQLELKATATLEVGLSMGASALVLAQTHKDLGHAPAAQHVAIDPWQEHMLSGLGLHAIERAGLASHFQFMGQTSDLALPRLVEEGQPFGLIYVDGSHWFEDVFLDCHYSNHLLEAGGVMLFDDSADPNIGQVLRFIRRNMGYALTEIDLSPYRADHGKSLRYRVGKAAGRKQLTAFRKIGEGRRPIANKTRRF